MRIHIFKKRATGVLLLVMAFLLLANNPFQLDTDLDVCDEVANVTIRKCEVIHIAIVCDNHDTIRNMATLVKSILYHRNNPIHFHFLSDKVAALILNTLFNTWRIPEVSVSIYSIEEAEKLIRYADTDRVEAFIQLLKVTFPNILPNDVNQLIILDPKAVLLVDIAELWQHLAQMSCMRNAAIGLVEGLTHHDKIIATEKHRPSPDLSREVKTIVILFDLVRLRQLNWPQLLLDNMREDDVEWLLEWDVDPLSTIAKLSPGLVYTLPPQWSVSLDDANTGTINLTSEAKIVHLHAPSGQSIDSQQASYLLRHYAKFIELDGADLRNSPFICRTDRHSLINPKFGLLDKADECHYIRRDSVRIRRTHLFYLHYEYTPLANDVTLITQMSLDRLYMLEALCAHWEGPISIALYLSDTEAHKLLSHVEFSSVLSSRTNVGYHVVFKTGTHYPINYLRNVALSQAKTPYVYLSDVDFLPMPTLYERLTRFLSKATAHKHRKKAYIVPAFEALPHLSTFPSDKNELFSGVQGGLLQQFHLKKCPMGHGPTNLSRWWSATQPYKVEWAKEFEPYIVVPRDVEMYDERFVGYGGNKISHIMELYAQGYEFVVLPDVFTVHLYHKRSTDARYFFRDEIFIRCLKLLKREFAQKLDRKYEEAAKNISIAWRKLRL